MPATFNRRPVRIGRPLQDARTGGGHGTQRSTRQIERGHVGRGGEDRKPFLVPLVDLRVEPGAPLRWLFFPEYGELLRRPRLRVVQGLRVTMKSPHKLAEMLIAAATGSADELLDGGAVRMAAGVVLFEQRNNIYELRGLEESSRRCAATVVFAPPSTIKRGPCWDVSCARCLTRW